MSLILGRMKREEPRKRWHFPEELEVVSAEKRATI